MVVSRPRLSTLPLPSRPLLRSIPRTDPITDQIPESFQTILPVDLFPLPISPAVVVNSNLIDPPFPCQRDLHADLHLDSKIVRGNAECLQDLASKHLVAGLDVAQRLIAQHIENQRN